MPTKKTTAPKEIYQIKITLLGTKPPIWRRLLVPSGLTLERLHDAVQVAMGWQDCHLHEFRIGQQRFGIPDPEDMLMGMPAAVNERTVRLFNVLGEAGSKAEYTYDFGDSWDHSIVVEKVLPIEPGRSYPACIGGKRRGPPEDCGGVPGYYNLIEALSDPRHDEHEEMLDWMPDDFDPEAFSADEVNTRLTPAHRSHSKTEGDPG